VKQNWEVQSVLYRRINAMQGDLGMASTTNGNGGVREGSLDEQNVDTRL
jgi:hypothetical protein